MREYSFNLKPGGLAATAESLAGQTLLRNLVPDDGFWLVPRVPAIPVGWTADKQAFRGRTDTLLCDASGVSLVDETDFSATAAVELAEPVPGWWHVADFGPMWIASNGTVLAVRMPRTPDEDDPSEYLTAALETPRWGAVAASGGRLIYGDIGTDGENLVGWSAAGGEDIPHLLTGTTPPAGVLALNEANRAPMPWRGRVLRILPMRDRVLVYGADGVTALRETGGTYGIEWITGLPSGVGIVSRLGADGNDDGHLFAGTDGALWFVSPDLSATRMETVVPVPAGATVAHSAADGEWWVSGASHSLVVTRHGVGGPVEAVVRSIARGPGGLSATGTDYPAQFTAELWGNLFDAGDASQKRLTFIRASGDGLSGVRCAVKARMTPGGMALANFPWVPCSPEGAAFVNCAMVTGQAGVIARAAPGARIWRIEVRYQPHDRRFVRGTRGIEQDQ